MWTTLCIIKTAVAHMLIYSEGLKLMRTDLAGRISHRRAAAAWAVLAAAAAAAGGPWGAPRPPRGADSPLLDCAAAVAAVARPKPPPLSSFLRALGPARPPALHSHAAPAGSHSTAWMVSLSRSQQEL